MATAAFNRKLLTRQLRQGGGVDTPQPHEKDDFVEAVMTMTVTQKADGEGGFGVGGPDGKGSGGRATARPPSLTITRRTTCAPATRAAQSEKKYSNRLRSAWMSLLSNEEYRCIEVEVRDCADGCRASVLSLRDLVRNDVMCASSSSAARHICHICHNDAGSPAICGGQNSDEDVTVGVLS